MRRIHGIFATLMMLTVTLLLSADAIAQTESGGVVRRRAGGNDRNQQKKQGQASVRMQSFFEEKPVHDADLQYMREIYRELDLEKPENSPLYFPEDVIDGKENLFRIMFNHVVNGDIPAYEYLDGREVFTDQYKIKVGEMLDRFDIYYTKGSGSTEKNPKYVIEEADVPTNQVLNYYILEKWEFDRRSNRMRTRVIAICPVLTRMSDFGGYTRYPMFWVKYDAIRPYLAQNYLFLSDDNNLEQYSIDDYFNLGMYKGDIYKTKNLRNLSMVQMYPDPDDLKQAQDSIDNRLRTYNMNLWVPTREEYLAQQEKAEADRARAEADKNRVPEREDNVVIGVEDEDGNIVVQDDEEKTPARTTKRGSKKDSSSSSSSTKKKSKAKKPKSISSGGGGNGSSNAGAEKSVRRRKK